MRKKENLLSHRSFFSKSFLAANLLFPFLMKSFKKRNSEKIRKKNQIKIEKVQNFAVNLLKFQRKIKLKSMVKTLCLSVARWNV